MGLWDERGVVCPVGVPVAQSWTEIGANLRVIHEFKVRTYIEIGMGAGGLSALLTARMDYDFGFTYYGVELDTEQLPLALKLKHRFHIYAGDVFSSVCQDWILEKIQANPGTALIFCDGGDKSREVQTFAPLLRSHDLIMAHDYESDLPAGYKNISPKWFGACRLVLLRK